MKMKIRMRMKKAGDKGGIRGILVRHEKLEVYQETIAFVAWLGPFIEGTVRIGDVRDQLDRASASMPFNIAEGNGKYSPKDRCRFFDNAHGSALECAAALDVLVARGKATRSEVRPGKERLQRIVRMLIGLIKRNSDRDYPKDDGRSASSSSSSSSSS